MSPDINFIKVLDKRTNKIVGFAALIRGSEEERAMIDHFLDLGICIATATESEFNQFAGDFIKKVDSSILCSHLPLAD